MLHLFIELIITLCQMTKAILRGMIYSFITPPLKSVQNEVVLITGAGSGLGRLMCAEFAKKGARIVALDVSKTANEETGRQIKEKGGAIYTYTCDVADCEAVYKTADMIKRDVGDVDILINNAGVVSGKKFLDSTDDMIEKTMEVNLLAHFWTIKCFLPQMVARNHGHVVTIASVAGLFGCNGLTDYCASKFGCFGFAESLEYELRASKCTGVQTTVVCPYFINTGMFDGCQTRFPRILPVLDPKKTVDKIMTAILTNQKIILIPRVMYILAVVKNILPVDAAIALNNFFGSTNLMSTFKGRGKRD